MRIEGISFKPASKQMSNDAVLKEVRRLSEPLFEDDLDKALVSIKYTLDQTQIRNRYWFDEEERPLDLICTVAKEALQKADLKAQDIDLLIYAGIGRGFLEPGDAYFVANALGMNDVDCFDVMDACMSWTRACDMAQSFFAAKRYKRILIVNCESYYVPGGISYPSNFELKRMREIAYCFSAYCGGDGASATVLVDDAANPWDFNFSSNKTGVDLCTIPLPGYEKRSLPSKYIGLNGIGAFTSFSSLVFNSAESHMVDILRRLEPHFADTKMLFPHTGGAIPAFQKWADSAGAGHLMRYIYPDYGNLGSCSIPAAISLHLESGELQRGDRSGWWMGSSGMSFVSASFRV